MRYLWKEGRESKHEIEVDFPIALSLSRVSITGWLFNIVQSGWTPKDRNIVHYKSLKTEVTYLGNGFAEHTRAVIINLALAESLCSVGNQ